MMVTVRPIENVWDYPRPPRLERVHWRVRVEHGGVVVADAPEVHRVLETTHPPVYYIVPEHVNTDLLQPSRARPTWCEWKGHAQYFDLLIGDERIHAVAWSYPDPVTAFAPIRGSLAFYPSKVDACFVDEERVRPQPGDFYGGWITSWIDGGPQGFKGGSGTWGW